MRFCCGVTLYYPSKKELKSIYKLKEVFDCVYLFDNTDNNSRYKNREVFINDNSFIYISHSENEGLSKAYNIMCKQAISKGFNYICLFDQDSNIDLKNLNKMITYIKNDIGKDIGIYVPEIIYMHKADDKGQLKYSNEAVGAEIEWAISSGSFINLNVYQITNGFDENYFIDRLDYDYCYTIKKLCYKVIEIKNTFLYQNLGEKRKGLFINISEHSPIRHYYIFRNRLYYYFRKNDITNKSYIKLFGISLRHIFTILLFEKNKIKKFQMIYKGLKDYCSNRMGKISD